MRIVRALQAQLSGWLEFIVTTWPDDPVGFYIRSRYWKFKIKHMGENPWIFRGAKIATPDLLDIGDQFILGYFADLNPSDSKGIFIGNKVAIARGVYLRAANHGISDSNCHILEQGHEYASISHNGRDYSIVIEDNVVISANAIILTGTHIGSDSIIGAGAVVSFKVPPYSVVLGNPGRVIRNRKG
jgi:acetyltransferase-like isoleucine patch superfamily enzyme